MHIPLPPYRARPMRSLAVRKVVTVEAIRDLLDENPVAIRPARATLRLAKPAKRTLKVLTHSDNDRE